jgi:NTP pyrophosphatase (non-canonical NTP hydrolase)
VILYLSGPMAGLPEHNYPAFNTAASALRALGHTVTNPAEIHALDSQDTWADYLRIDLEHLLRCEAVALLPGWQNSRGAQLETHVARALGMPLLAADTLTHVAPIPTTGLDRVWCTGLRLPQLQSLIHAWARGKGWWERERNTAELLALAHSELSEALEIYRNGEPLDLIWDNPFNGKPEGFPIELADCVIRILDTAQAHGIDLEAALLRKMLYNEDRVHRHGGKLA